MKSKINMDHYNIFKNYIAKSLFIEDILDRVFSDAEQAGKNEADIIQYIENDFLRDLDLALEERLTRNF